MTLDVSTVRSQGRASNKAHAADQGNWEGGLRGAFGRPPGAHEEALYVPQAKNQCQNQAPLYPELSAVRIIDMRPRTSTNAVDTKTSASHCPH